MRKHCGLVFGTARPFGDRRWLLPFLASMLIAATLLLAAAAASSRRPTPVAAPSYSTWHPIGSPTRTTTLSSREPRAAFSISDVRRC
ncbi:unnamed protein product [Urochloa humidicola]